MPSFNRIIMMGNLTRDPVLSYLPSNTPVVDFSVATNRKWKAQDGSEREEVCFVEAKCFGKTGENIAKYFKKGRPILLEGRLSFSQWQTQDGQKRSKHYITVESFTFVDDSQKQGEAEGKFYPPAEEQQAAPTVDEDEIPF